MIRLDVTVRATRRITAVAVAAATAAAAGVTGCGGEQPRPNPGGAETVGYGSVGTSAQIDCAAGKSLDVTGSNNSLTVLGACWTVRVSGADNRIRLERVDGDLSVTGLNNIIDYRHGDPAVHDEGSGNRISRG